jgi:hypothetical protein
MPAFRSHPNFYVEMNLSSRVRTFPRVCPVAQFRHPLLALFFRIIVIGIQMMNAPISSVMASSSIDCPDGPFETDIDKISKKSPVETPTVRSQQKANFAVPIEVSRILEGGIFYFQGGLMNQGTTTWYAFDIERRLLIAVLTSTGDRSGRIPAVEKLRSDQLLRYTDAAGYPRAEFVTVIAATPTQVREFSCLANKLLASPSERSNRPTPEDVMIKTFSLLHDGKSLDLGGGLIRWEIEAQIERLISQPLQELIMQTS